MSLLILKIDYFNENSSAPIIRYEVFNPETKEDLSLSYCNDTLINLNIPVSIDEENIFKYDPTNDYYTDLCKAFTTQSGTDIILNDRHNEFNNNNMAICEKNCSFIGYEQDTKKAKCECEINLDQLSISAINNQSDIFHYNFTSKNTSTNMATMKCAYTLFTKDGISSNIACYIFIFFIPFFIATGIFFYKCGFQFLEDIIQEIISLKEEKIKSIKYNKDINKNETIDINNNEEKGKKGIKKSKNNKKKKKSKKGKKKRNSNSQIKQLTNNNSKLSVLPSNNDIIDNNKSHNENLDLTYNNYELNNLSYENSLKYDKRTYFQVYISLIVLKHPIIFSFYPRKDYNSMIIKIDIFLLSVSLYYFVNALFFDENAIHKIYEDEGIYNFIYLIPFILYSFIIAHTLTIIIKYFFLSERNIYEIKNAEKIEIVNEKAYKAKKCLIYKYIIFFVAGTLFLLFFWYYLSSFGAVYKNTQIYLMKNVLISLGFSILYPFIINFVPAALRIYSLKKNNRNILYKINRIIQLF